LNILQENDSLIFDASEKLVKKHITDFGKTK
jgi:hypothetical protein